MPWLRMGCTRCELIRRGPLDRGGQPDDVWLEIHAGHLDGDADADRGAVVVVHLDRALQFARDEGLDDREAEAAGAFESEAFGETGAVVAHLDLDVVAIALER